MGLWVEGPQGRAVLPCHTCITLAGPCRRQQVRKFLHVLSLCWSQVMREAQEKSLKSFIYDKRQGRDLGHGGMREIKAPLSQGAKCP